MKKENQQQEDNWFASWFDSPFYPLLYRHRNEEEAEMALRNLHELLQLPEGSRVLDLCCGQGRHSRTLSRLGYRVTGIDLSPASIAVAKSQPQENQHFEIQDMRSFELKQHFDAVFNLFTSFGYFNDSSDNMRVLHRIGAHLTNNGLLVIDYLNAFPLFNQTYQENRTTVDQISFYTRKFVEGDFVVKLIEVTDESGGIHLFREQVQLITLDNFQSMLHGTGFEIIHTFGNYRLESFTPETSERCIIIARKS
ncbi:MAG: class I SAM-dependent methyltransferase [Flavobacteriales bacterium]